MENNNKVYTKLNLYIIEGGVLSVLIGYLILYLTRGNWDSFWALDVAPIFFVLGYLVLIPIGILYKKKV